MGVAALSICSTSAMDTQEKWIEMKDVFQMTRQAITVDEPVPLQGHGKNLTPEGWKINPKRKNAVDLDNGIDNYYNPYRKLYNFPLFYYDYSITWL
jgi:hypothetical protein